MEESLLKIQSKILGVVIVATAIIFTGCGSEKQSTVQPTLVTTQTVDFSTFSQGSIYSGSVVGRFESQLAFQVNGKINARLVDPGTRVTAGQALLRIDPKDVQQSVNMSNAQVASALSQLNLAKVNYDRYQRLFSQGAVSASDFDNMRTNYEAAQASYNEAIANQTINHNSLDYTSLRADVAGVIAAVSADVGQVVAAGQVVATLVEDGQIEILTAIPENKMGAITEGQPVTVQFWALPQLTVNGYVREITPVADSTTRTYKTRIALENPPASVRYGMTASVNINDGGTGGAQVVLLPLSAIYQTDSEPQVWVVKDNKVALRSVKIEQYANNQVKVISGLNDNDVVVTAGVQKLRAGQEVRTSD